MKFKTIKIISTIGLLFLIGAFFEGLPYAYFQILRLVVTITFLCLWYVAYEQKLNRLALINFIFIIIFQSLFPIYFERTVWLFFDAVAIVLILVSLIKIYRKLVLVANKKLKPLYDVMEKWKLEEQRFAEIDILKEKEKMERKSGNWKEADLFHRKWNIMLEEIEKENVEMETKSFPKGF
jgi:hypothetical protein